MLKKVVLILIITLAIAIIGMTAAMFYFIKKNMEIKKNSLPDGKAPEEAEEEAGSTTSADPERSQEPKP